MKIQVNGCEWEIIEKTQEEIRSELLERAKKGYEEEPAIGMYFGVTLHDVQQILLDKNLPKDRKKKTLTHELAHCYIGAFVTHQSKTYDEEMVCDIVANSYLLIHETIEKYFNV